MYKGNTRVTKHTSCDDVFALMISCIDDHP